MVAPGARLAIGQDKAGVKNASLTVRLLSVVLPVFLTVKVKFTTSPAVVYGPLAALTKLNDEVRAGPVTVLLLVSVAISALAAEAVLTTWPASNSA